jgi:lambda family phage tail tape measure protein
MATAATASITLQANIDQFNASMRTASQNADRAMQDMQDSARQVGAAMGAMGAVAAGALVVMVKNTIDAADNLRDMSQKTGIAVEILNGLGFAAGQAGGSLESMVAAAGKLNKTITEAASGNKEAVEAFKVLGISITDTSGNLKTADVVMAEVADQFENFKDGPEKSALALALFGKAGADMIPLLNDGGAAMRENTEYAQKYSGMTTELANASDNFNDTMGKLTLHQTRFANEMTKAVLPILQAVADETLTAAEQSDKFALAGNGVRNVMQTLVVMGSEVAYTFGRIGNMLGGAAAQVSALGISFGDIAGGPAAMTVALGRAVITGEASFSRFNDINQMIKDDNDKAQKDHEDFLHRVLNPPTAKAAATGGPPKKSPPRLADSGGKGQDPDADFKAYLKNLQGQIQKTQELTAIEKLLADVRSGNLTVSSSQEQQLTLLADAVDREKEMVTTIKLKRDASIAAGDAVMKENEEYRLQKIAFDDATASAKAYIDTITRQNSRELAGVGRGGKFREEQSGISQIEDKQTTSRQALEADLRNGKIARAQFDLYLETVNSTYSQEIEAYRDRNAAITALQGDWTTGASEAFSNYFDNVSNVAASTEQLFGSAFKGMEDALVSFVQTGKLDFSSLANSMIADMARIAIQQSITKPLMGAATSLLGGMFTVNAKGNVYSSPSLSAYSGGVYDSPKTFAFAKGAGIFAEAGPEAIMPLARGADGSLGVRASGGGGSSMVVNIIESPGNGGQQSRRSENGVDILDIMVEKVKSAIASDITRGSGAIPASLSRTYGMNRTVGAY